VVHDPDSGAVAVFALNRSAEPMALSVELRGMQNLAVTESLELRHEDLKAVNTSQHPDAVSPTAHPDCTCGNGGLRATLKPLSWNVFALRGK
jgi:alpha-L-arabinofuranosidase